MKRPVGLALALSLLAPVAHAELSAGGRKKGPKPPVTTRPGPGTTRPRPPDARPPDAPPKGPTDDALILRYMGIVLAQVGSPFPLQRLAELHRKRDGDLKKLVEELERRAADASSPESFAAKVALAGVFKLEGKPDEARRRYEAAVAARPSDPAVRLALAELLREQGDRAAARAQYDEALKHQSSAVDKEQTLRTLRAMMLDAKQLDDARGYHAALVKVSGSLAVRGELGRELLARGDAAHAEEELAAVVKAAAGDNRALAPALLELGRAQAAQSKTKDAIATLRRALSVAGGEAGVRGEILSVIAAAHRKDGSLKELVSLMEREAGGDAAKLRLLASLYEETGELVKAVSTYRRLVSGGKKEIEARVRLVRLLQSTGDLDGAIAESERLAGAAPKNPDFVFQLAEAYLARGDRKRALEVVERLLRAAGRDDDVLTRVADFYERIEEKERALALVTRLAQSGSSDPSHLVDLGDRYWQAGDKKKAEETWQRLTTTVPNKIEGLRALGDVQFEHDLVDQAIATYQEAMRRAPGDLKLKKSFALALERAATFLGTGLARSGRLETAREVWQELLEKSGPDRLLAREARGHLVLIWGLQKQLEQKVEPLRLRLADDPPDLDAGRLLAEVLLKLGRPAPAEEALARVVEKAPGDEEAFLLLERVRVQSKNLPGAIEALVRLAELNPKRAREYYQRAAQHSADLFKDDDAIRFAEKALALSPDDAEGHRRLAAMYRRKGDLARARAAYYQAIARNDRLFPAYLELAEVLVAQEKPEEASLLWRRVVRGSPDEELVATAARLAMQHHLARGTLSELETDLLPLVLAHPQKPLYRRTLVEVYGQMAAPLVAALRSPKPEAREAARLALTKLGGRGVKPLLDALSDEQKSQAGVAIDVLSHVENRGAGPALFSFATGNAELPLRARAMVAVGMLRDPALLPRFEALLAPQGDEAVAPGDAVTVAAAWGVARMADKRATALLTGLLDAPSGDVRAMAALGLGLHGDRSSVPALARLTGQAAAPPVVRAAALSSLAMQAGRDAAPTLVGLTDARDPLVRGAAVLALARIGDQRARALAERALFSLDPAERARGVAALARPSVTSPALSAPDSGALDVAAVLASVTLAAPSDADLDKALLASPRTLAAAVTAALSGSPERARVALSLARTGAFPFRPATPATRAAHDELAAALTAGAVTWANTGHGEVRAEALEALGHGTGDAAQAALARALGDEDPSVVRAALSAAKDSEAFVAVGALAPLLTRPRWSDRADAARAVGLVAARASGADRAAAVDSLRALARADAFAAVRVAAVRALARLGGSDRELAEIARTDVEPEVREAAGAR
ncbi:MAG: tetratricopeptide repeat protein [Polyangiaceae bacterium]|nr:tetratricopeptide repeat protein [Polyangiaceae bacterium]